MDFINNLRDMNAWWLPVLVFVFFSIIGIIFGAINGWKSSLYWFAINIVGAGIAMGVTISIWGKIEEPINKLLSNQSINVSNLEIVKGAAILASMFGLTLVLNLIALVVYFFLRKKFKGSIRRNKASGMSNISSRLLGAGLGIFSVLPTSLLFTSVSTLGSTNKNVNRWFSGFVKLTTFGVVDDISEDYEGIYAIASSVDALDDLGKIFTAEDLDDISTKKIEESADKINTIFENNKSYPLLKEIIENQKGIDKDAKLDENAINEIKNKVKKGIFKNFSDKAKENAKKIINDHFKKSGETKDVATILIDFLTDGS